MTKVDSTQNTQASLHSDCSQPVCTLVSDVGRKTGFLLHGKGCSETLVLPSALKRHETSKQREFIIGSLAIGSPELLGSGLSSHNLLDQNLSAHNWIYLQ